MNPLVAKEVRLILPTFGVALLMATSPLWPTESPANGAAFTGIGWLALCLGLVLLALVPMGREFSLKTFPFLLSQPVPRARIWRTKLAVLGIAMTTVFFVWSFCFAIFAPFGGSMPGAATWSGWPVELEMLIFMALATVVIFAGGLWTTLLVRQSIAAFWFTVFFPVALLVLIMRESDGPLKLVALLALYSVAGLVFAWWQFRRAQDAGWSGGIVSLGGWQFSSSSADATQRTHRRRPIRALFWKELRLQEVTLAGMAGLFVLHLGVVMLRGFWHPDPSSKNSIMQFGLEVFGVLWLMVPFFAGCASIAEERRLGTLEPQSCLPVSRRRQFALKLLIVLVLGGLLAPLLGLTVEGIGEAFGLKAAFSPQSLFSWTGALAVIAVLLLFAAVSAVSFYASTLARNIIQAMAAALGTAFGAGLVVTLAQRCFRSDATLFSGALLPALIVWPAMFLTCAWLTYRNFTSFSDGWPFWSRNVFGAVSSIVLSVGLSAALYNRVWEVFMPEAPHGPARMAMLDPLTCQLGDWGLSAVLPDGRLWHQDLVVQPAENGVNKWRSLASGQFDGHSNWIAVVNFDGTIARNIRGTNQFGTLTNSYVPMTVHETAGIRADGSLWISEEPRQKIERRPGQPLPEIGKLARSGEETNWQSVVQLGWWDLLLLKNDGSLWAWNGFFEGGMRGIVAPHRLGGEADWAGLFRPPGSYRTYARKKDGTVWELSQSLKPPSESQVRLEAGWLIGRCEALEGHEWRSLGESGGVRLSVRSDGTLWIWGDKPGGGWVGDFSSSPRRVGTASDWAAVAGESRYFAGLKTDGSLWRWDWPMIGIDHGGWNLYNQPVRLGGQRDWVGLGITQEGVLSLAADGGLWFWRSPEDFRRQERKPLLGLSRRPELVENIFAKEK